MNILISGSTGMIGTALIEALKKQNHRVMRLVRSPLQSSEPTVQWNPTALRFDIPVMLAVAVLADFLHRQSRLTPKRRALPRLLYRVHVVFDFSRDGARRASAP